MGIIHMIQTTQQCVKTVRHYHDLNADFALIKHTYSAMVSHLLTLNFQESWKFFTILNMYKKYVGK